MHARRSLIAVPAIALVLSGCSAVTGRSLPQVVSDATITTQVKSRLAVTEGVGSVRDVSVRTYDDWVELSGTVADGAQRDRIEREARRIAGDNRVVNNLQVLGETSASPATTGTR
jgi:osmotically-inducible protein OsmY